ncbi:GNAT superfamily N-acetyltransferase [Pararhizobium capsulatum DSM 1112]|uniref:GNAT superfamily N-acetyltransferase n=1 Tax=Pararhizobium capsulatum DSM 1112 TaxID=1121113 RepID=A0ABU0BKG3_9HYPH|nr:GNAT family N-acetyltransferase [Pararhizobium capsulatum]MDQ0318383.1 GNAT superfamily N-acetyltransferase [Pararhizobium capsulatum DSM 1112]
MNQPVLHVLSSAQAETAIPALCEILSDCVEGGASVGFLTPYSTADALPYWRGVVSAIQVGETVLIAAKLGEDIVGTVQLGIGTMPNQPHRADLKKLLVHRRARGLGLARLLMERAEAEALHHKRHVLVLDTATGSAAETIYSKLGWQRVGVIPQYALMPDGSYCGSTFFYKSLSAI